MNKLIETIQDLVAYSESKYLDKPAFISTHENVYHKISFKEVHNIIKRITRLLEKNNIKPSDKVGILSENRPEWALVHLAITSMGAVAVPLDSMANSTEIANLLRESESKMVFISKSMKDKNVFTCKTFLMEEIEALIEKSETHYKVSKENLAAIVYTSGTTGDSKGVMLSHDNIISNVLSISSLFDISLKDNFLSVLPLNHMFETTAGFLGPFYCGASITFTDSLKSYNLLRIMQDTKVTIMCAVPLLFNLFYDGIEREVSEKGFLANSFFSLLKFISKLLSYQKLRKFLFSMIHKKLGGHIRFWVSGGAAIAPNIIKGFDLFGITILQGYGLTEASPILTCNTLKENRIGSVGKPIPGVKISIGEKGELLACGKNIMKGYYKRQELTDEVLQDNWLHTGDVGKIDENGYIYITGRLKDVIITEAGVNIYPEEIEAYLNKLPGVKESCVLGYNATKGREAGPEKVAAIIFPDYLFFEKQKISDEANIKDHLQNKVYILNRNLAEFKRISKIELAKNEFPKTSTRKIKKSEVKKALNLEA